MSTGLVSVDRGFDFATEEHGVEIRRIQTNLSERRVGYDSPGGGWGKGKGTLRKMFPLRKPKALKEVSVPAAHEEALGSPASTAARSSTIEGGRGERGEDEESKRPVSGSSRGH